MAGSGAVRGRGALSTGWPFRGTEVEGRGGNLEEKREQRERKWVVGCP